ncbi:hypothetical protein PZA11_002983 [Diplocarpon coronariae]|uniref:GPI anchored serine-threonine rich protein n=1 Tax=Diplocarpon coronariae TaxID=2795749 RepID=A0A218Z4W3_9HELO|nr:hypothetical protein JHW43_005827 [Diplocarpon mali]OWP03028.1 GPI anchored serine-threonine rich protein [Marssonina coronariae]
MQFSSTLLLMAWAALAAAQNPFTFNELDSVTAGQPFTITWAPSTGSVDTVTLLLRQGDSDNLSTVETIASNVKNTGSYVWTPSTSLVNGDGYAFEIVDDGNTDIVNYSKQFSIVSTNTVSSVRPSSTTAESSASATSASTTSESSASSSASTSASTSASSSSSESATSTQSRTRTSASTETETASRTATSSSGTGSATVSPTALNGSGSLKVGVGMLAMVGAVMALL